MKKLKVPICSDFQSEQLDIFIVFVGAIFSEKKGGPFYCRGPIYCRRVYIRIFMWSMRITHLLTKYGSIKLS